MNNNEREIKTLGALKKSGYKSRTVKEEIRENLIAKLKSGMEIFPGVIGYEETVIPAITRALLAGHNINFLGLRGQAKTRMAREMIHLLDDYIPIIKGSELNEDPLKPITLASRSLIENMGDDTPVEWLIREDRYTEKLATPDVSIADLIGDTDPIKAANLKLDYSDERVIHFGLIPRAHRGIFVINELPDLQPRIQVALFNILQEGDIQIRSHKFRLSLDIHFVFTANPEDYTNRGAIITPLKDRIQSQIITHYPPTLADAKSITKQEAKIPVSTDLKIEIPELIEDLIEEIAIEARVSELIDQKSGVSARLSITAYENLISTIERRIIINKERKGFARIGDLYGVLPSITGKVELVYEGEQEGATNVAFQLIGKTIRKKFPTLFPDPEAIRKRKKMDNIYQPLVEWFNTNEVDLLSDLDQATYEKTLRKIPGLKEIVLKYFPKTTGNYELFLMELVLHGLSEYSMLRKDYLTVGFGFSDILSSVFSIDEEDEGFSQPGDQF